MSSSRAQVLRAHAQALGVELAESAAQDLVAFLDAMLERNRAINLTAVRDPAAALVLHGLDSVALGLAALPAQQVADVGSGNGFPGVAAAVLYPRARVVLVERTAKKARVLTELTRGTGLDNLRVVHADAAQLPSLEPPLRRSFDLVCMRAVAPPGEAAALAAPLLAPGGHLVLWLTEEMAAQPAPVAGFTPLRSVPYELPAPAARHRRLAIWRRAENDLSARSTRRRTR